MINIIFFKKNHTQQLYKDGRIPITLPKITYNYIYIYIYIYIRFPLFLTDHTEVIIKNNNNNNNNAMTKRERGGDET